MIKFILIATLWYGNASSSVTATFQDLPSCENAIRVIKERYNNTRVDIIGICIPEAYGIE